MRDSLISDWTKDEPGIRLYKCRDCHHVFYFEREFCPSCGAEEPSPFLSNGVGVIEAKSIVRRAPDEALRAHAPYAIAMIRLDEGPLIMAQAELSGEVGDMVTSSFKPFGGQNTVPYFSKKDAEK